MNLEHRQKLGNFLRKIADEIDNEKMSNQNLDKIKEFYTDYSLNNYSLDSKFEISEYNENELMKFFTAGWFFYNNIIQD